MPISWKKKQKNVIGDSCLHFVRNDVLLLTCRVSLVLLVLLALLVVLVIG